MALDGITLTEKKKTTTTKKKKRWSIGECRARSDYTYVQSDLALHFPHNLSMATNDQIRVKSKETSQAYQKLCMIVNTDNSQHTGENHEQSRKNGDWCLINPSTSICLIAWGVSTVFQLYNGDMFPGLLLPVLNLSIILTLAGQS